MVEWLVVVFIVVVAVLPWKFSVKDMKETNIPNACFDCNRGGCVGCALEGLTKEEANKVASQITQQAIADGTVPYKRRFERG